MWTLVNHCRINKECYGRACHAAPIVISVISCDPSIQASCMSRFPHLGPYLYCIFCLSNQDLQCLAVCLLHLLLYHAILSCARSLVLFFYKKSLVSFHKGIEIRLGSRFPHTLSSYPAQALTDYDSKDALEGLIGIRRDFRRDFRRLLAPACPFTSGHDGRHGLSAWFKDASLKKTT